MPQKVVYLIPCHLAEDTRPGILSYYNQEVIKQVSHYFVENVRSARRFISSLQLGIKIDSLHFYELTKDTEKSQICQLIDALPSDISEVGILSEAGCPGIADPGSKLIAVAHSKSWKVIPIPGPSSIYLSLMASGFGGQRFFFHGYLPIKQEDRVRTIRKIEEESQAKGVTHLFIETPFRNVAMLADLLSTLKPHTYLCIAANLTGQSEFVQTKKVLEWKKNLPEIHKVPCIFLIGAYEDNF